MINTDFLTKCTSNLILAADLLAKQKRGNDLYEVYRSAVIKEFELILEQSGKLLKKAISPYFSSNKQTDDMFFKDIFRYAHKFGLLDEKETKRWLEYRDSRNQSAHNYGENLADETIKLLPQFIIDVQNLINNIKKSNATKK